jgi:hypothetical protein
MRPLGNDPDEFAEAPELAMDFQFGRSSDNEFFPVVGCRMGILLDESTFPDPQVGDLSERWRSPGLSAKEREAPP